jgi:hypothetical protein
MPQMMCQSNISYDLAVIFQIMCQWVFSERAMSPICHSWIRQLDKAQGYLQRMPGACGTCLYRCIGRGTGISCCWIRDLDIYGWISWISWIRDLDIFNGCRVPLVRRPVDRKGPVARTNGKNSNKRDTDTDTDTDRQTPAHTWHTPTVVSECVCVCVCACE